MPRLGAHMSVAGGLPRAVDTCHLLAAGYDLCSPEGYAATLGSHVDRHQHIGRG